MKVNFQAQEMYFAGIRGVGHAVPDNIVTNDDLAQRIETSDQWIRTKIGVGARRIATEDDSLSGLAVQAAGQALANAQLDPQDIDLIILGRLDPDHITPATSALIQARLGAVHAGAFDLSVGGCPGSVYSLAVGADFVKSGACKNVLVITGDLNSRNMINWDDRNTCCFFGDGVGAVVISRLQREGGIKSYQLMTDGSGYRTVEVPFGGTATPITKENVTSPKRYFRMDGKAVRDFAVTRGSEVIEEVTRLAESRVEDLDMVIFHQANINIIKDCMKKLQLPMEKSFVNIENYGNTGGGSVILALSEAVEQGQIQRGDRVALSAFGAGLSWAGMYLEWSDLSEFL